MQELAISLLIGLTKRLLTEVFFSKLVGHSALVLAKSTKNTLTKEMATDVANALGVTKLDAQDDETKLAS